MMMMAAGKSIPPKNSKPTNSIIGKDSGPPIVKERERSTSHVKGRRYATFCAHKGRVSIGKNVPPKRNIGVTNRKIGRLNISMVETKPVKNIPKIGRASCRERV